jgi:PAS domain S-box-containing protein
MTPARFSQFSLFLPEPMLLVSGRGIILSANPAVFECFAISAAQICGKHVTDIVDDPPGDVERYLRLCAGSRSLVPGALTLSRPGNSSVACRVEGALVNPFDAAEEPALQLRLTSEQTTNNQFLLLNQRIEELASEILRRKQTEDALRQQKEWLEVLLASIDDAVIATDETGLIVFMNPIAEAYVGCHEAEAVGKPLTEWFQIVNEQTREPAANPVAVLIRSEATVALVNHTLLLSRDGTERMIEDSAAPIRDEHGQLRGVILVFRDVTPQRLADRELKRGVQKKDEFLAILAHELRNPLAPIRNALEVLKRSDGGTTASEAHGIMERQLSQMVRLIDDLLDISRISRGKLALQLDHVELAAIIRHALESCRPMIEAARHEVSLKLHSEPIYLKADSVRLSQVFANLVNNACKFTKVAGRIEIAAEIDADHAVVSVKDNGIGIPPDQLSRVFEMFSQVDSSLERSQGGLGIGLALVKEVVQMHGGTTEARSAGIGRGSELVVRLPFYNVPRSTRPVQASSPAKQQVTRSRILVVDDNHDSAITLSMLLKFAGHETHTAHDGLEAIEVASTLRPDIILLDIGMPKLNGYDTCRRIREQDWGANIVIVALTGWGHEEDRRKSRAAGFNAHLVKPVEHTELAAILMELQKSSRTVHGGE